VPGPEAAEALNDCYKVSARYADLVGKAVVKFSSLSCPSFDMLLQGSHESICMYHTNALDEDKVRLLHHYALSRDFDHSSQLLI
jgi:hypothetical protein